MIRRAMPKERGLMFQRGTAENRKNVGDRIRCLRLVGTFPPSLPFAVAIARLTLCTIKRGVAESLEPWRPHVTYEAMTCDSSLPSR